MGCNSFYPFGSWNEESQTDFYETRLILERTLFYKSSLGDVTNDVTEAMSPHRVELCCHVACLFSATRGRPRRDPPHPPSWLLRWCPCVSSLDRCPIWPPLTPPPLPCWGSICSGVEAAAGRQLPASSFFSQQTGGTRGEGGRKDAAMEWRENMSLFRGEGGAYTKSI